MRGWRTQALAGNWPHRFLTDADADPLLRLLEDLRRAGRQVAIMAHVTQWCGLNRAGVCQVIGLRKA
jgi:hypothetical protein